MEFEPNLYGFVIGWDSIVKGKNILGGTKSEATRTRTRT